MVEKMTNKNILFWFIGKSYLDMKIIIKTSLFSESKIIKAFYSGKQAKYSELLFKKNGLFKKITKMNLSIRTTKEMILF